MTAIQKFTAAQLADVIENDTEITEMGINLAESEDKIKRAPAQLAAYHILNVYTSEQLAFFADPGSSEEDLTDGNGMKVGENLARDYVWDKYKHTDQMTAQEVSGQWYLDFVDRTPYGRQVNGPRDAITAFKKGDKDARFTDDGVVWFVRDLRSSDDADKILRKYTARRTKWANRWRDAIGIIRQMTALSTRFGNQVDDNGAVTKAGVIEIEWNYHDPSDPDKGLDSEPLRIYAVYPEGPKAGQRIGPSVTFTVNQFLNLDVANAITRGSTYAGVVASERVKADKTSAGQGGTPTPTATDGKSKIKLAQLANVFTNMRLFFEHEDDVRAFQRQLATMKREDVMHVYRDMYALHNKLTGMLTPDIVKAVETEIAAEDAKVAAETAAKIAAQNAGTAPAQPQQQAARKRA